MKVQISLSDFYRFCFRQGGINISSCCICFYAFYTEIIRLPRRQTLNGNRILTGHAAVCQSDKLVRGVVYDILVLPGRFSPFHHNLAFPSADTFLISGFFAVTLLILAPSGLPPHPPLHIVLVTVLSGSSVTTGCPSAANVYTFYYTRTLSYPWSFLYTQERPYNMCHRPKAFRLYI